MLNETELEQIAQMIPAKTAYAVIASWSDIDETAQDWDDWEHIHFCHDWASACDARRLIESEGLKAYIIEPEGVIDELEA